MKPLRLGTRGSQLALWQARAVSTAIERAGGPPCELVVIKTSGDRLAEASLADAGGKRLFVKEIEDALVSGTIDLAVHSAKDLPVMLAGGLTIGAVPMREDPRDCVVLPEGRTAPEGICELVAALGQSPRVGTSSVRRIAQLTRLWPGARFEPIRGNLDTRLRKLDRGDFDALVLAAAGLRRLGLADRVTSELPVSACVPAPGQGTLAVEIRADDPATRKVIATIDDESAAAQLAAERALVTTLGGGCQLPVGAVAIQDGDQLTLHAVVVSLDGSRAVRAEGRGRVSDAVTLGEGVAARLIAEGAAEILGAIQNAAAPEGSP